MRVLVVNMALDPATGGGTAGKARQLAAGFARSGDKTSLLTLDVGLTPSVRRELEGCTIHEIPALWRRFWIPGIRPSRVADAVRDADVALLLNHWTLLNVVAGRACRRRGIPYFVCPSGALPIFGRSRLLKRAFNAVAGQRLVRDARGVIATIPSEVDDAAAYGVPRGRTRVIPNPVPSLPSGEGVPEPFAAPRGIRRPFVLFLGRLAAIKGPDLLLEAWTAGGFGGRGFSLVFAGRDEGLGDALRRAASRHAPSVHFVGHLDAREVRSALAEAALLAVPSRREAMSLVALEAGAAGVPVLATDVCGLALAPETGGFEVPATAAALRDGLETALADPDALKRIGDHLRSRVREEFSLDAVVAAYRRAFEEAIRTRPSGHGEGFSAPGGR